jgi:hypothetical protein
MESDSMVGATRIWLSLALMCFALILAAMLWS